MSTLGESELRRLSELRALLEGFAARHAAARVGRSPDQLAPLRAVLGRLTAATRQGDYRSFRAADHALHAGLVRLAAVPQLTQAWQGVWQALLDFHRRAFEECFPDPRFLSDAHEHLIATIALGDPIAAEDAARSHVEAVWFRLAEQQGAPACDGAQALQRAAAHLAFALARPLRLHEVAADVAFTSPGNLSRLFRRRYGMSFQAYLQKLRIEKAAELLRTTTLPVALIARRVGYRDVSRFGQHFKRRCHATPTAYRTASLRTT